MRDEYDFTDAKRVHEVPHLARLQADNAKNKTRISIYIDNDILDAYRAAAGGQGKGYQTLINDTLREKLTPAAAPLTEDALRRVLSEVLPKTAA